MTDSLLDAAARRAAQADLVVKTDETVTLSFESGRLKATSFSQERGVNLRVVVDGRLGFAGSTAADTDRLLEAAFGSARLGEQVDLPLPPPADLPSVQTHYARAAAASLADLAYLGRMVVDRLGRDGCQVSATVERSVGSVRVANSRGVEASYDVSSVAVSAELVRVSGDDILIIADYHAGANLPDLPTLEAMVGGMVERLHWAGKKADAPAGSLRVCFTSSGSGVLFLPLHLACLGKSVLHRISPLGDKLNTRAFSSSFSLIDDPLLDGRSGSRPIDDEGVPSRRIPLVDQGTVKRFVYDLETAGLVHAEPTGHGRRSTFGKPQAAYTNLLVSPGPHGRDELLRLIDDGLLVDELLGVGEGNVIGGAFSHPVALGYRVIGGEVVGRVTDVAVAGNAYDLLNRIAGIGTDARWVGSSCVPPLVVEGVAVTKR